MPRYSVERPQELFTQFCSELVPHERKSSLNDSDPDNEGRQVRYKKISKSIL